MSTLKLNTSLFLRLLELAREEIKDDKDLHLISEAVAKISRKKVAEMEDYKTILQYVKDNGSLEPDELERIRQLGGV